jgi:hypothetical protein
MKRTYLAVTYVLTGLLAGILGGFVTRELLLATGFLTGAAAAFAFWVVLIGGLYKGFSAARKLF